MTTWTRSMGLLALLTLSTLGCGAAAATSTNGGRSTNRDTRGVARAPRVEGEGSERSPFLLCLGHGAPRTDYAFVANWQCSDGQRPLGGVDERGAAARLGNVGAGPDGHIVDLYEVPCSSGPVRIYVDGYHCSAGGDAPVDMQRLTQQQLTTMARNIRALHRDAFSARALEMRAQLLVWVLASSQVSVVICPTVTALLPLDDPRNPYMGELMISYAASLIEDGRPQADPVTTTEMALAGVVVFYETLIAHDPSAANPLMERLRSAAHGGTLRTVAQQATGQCSGWDTHGVHDVRR